MRIISFKWEHICRVLCKLLSAIQTLVNNTIIRLLLLQTLSWIMIFSALLERWCLSSSTEAPRQCFQIFFPSSLTWFLEWMGNWIHYEFYWHQHESKVYGSEVTNDRMLLQGLVGAGSTSRGASPIFLGSGINNLCTAPRLPPTLSTLQSFRQHQLSAWLGPETPGMSDTYLTPALWGLSHLDKHPLLRFWSVPVNPASLGTIYSFYLWGNWGSYGKGDLLQVT